VIAAASYDFCVVGGGIAGLSAAAELAAHGRVLLLEREAALAQHATGRSAALFAEFYGNAPVRALTRASRAFYERPPAAFARSPLGRRGTLFVGTEAQRPAVEAFQALLQQGGARPVWLDAAALRAQVPVLTTATMGLLDAVAEDIDVGVVVDGFVRLLRERGGEIRRNSAPRALQRHGDRYRVELDDTTLDVRVVVNAAGAWAGEFAAFAGATAIPMTPMRRTAFVVDLPDGIDARPWPCVIDIDEQLYFKSDAGRLLVSPADETPSVPCDAWADDLDVAIAVERLEAMTSLRVAQVRSSWAGLRTFAPDRTPVVGFDPRLPGFFWLAGQGGYGLQTAPAMARAAAALASGSAWPEDLAAAGLQPEQLSPRRFAAGT
jgi:D-arginine dehydrogenase